MLNPDNSATCIAALRKRAWHFLEPSAAASANLTLDQMQRFLAGTLELTDDQIIRLARRVGLAEECCNG